MLSLVLTYLHSRFLEREGVKKVGVGQEVGDGGSGWKWNGENRPETPVGARQRMKIDHVRGWREKKKKWETARMARNGKMKKGTNGLVLLDYIVIAKHGRSPFTDGSWVFSRAGVYTFVHAS